VDHAENRVTSVRRARVNVLDDWRYSCQAGTTAIAELDAVARVGVGARRASRHRDVDDSHQRVAAIRRAGWYGHVLDAQHRVAAVVSVATAQLYTAPDQVDLKDAVNRLVAIEEPRGPPSK
jgi:hypothetical protein